MCISSSSFDRLVSRRQVNRHWNRIETPMPFLGRRAFTTRGELKAEIISAESVTCTRLISDSCNGGQGSVCNCRNSATTSSQCSRRRKGPRSNRGSASRNHESDVVYPHSKRKSQRKRTKWRPLHYHSGVLREAFLPISLSSDDDALQSLSFDHQQRMCGRHYEHDLARTPSFLSANPTPK